MTKEEVALRCIEQLTESFDLLDEMKSEFLCGNILCTTEIPAADFFFTGHVMLNMACVRQIKRVQTSSNIVVCHSLARGRQFVHLIAMTNDRVPAMKRWEDGETRYLAAILDMKSRRVDVGYVRLRGVNGYLALINSLIPPGGMSPASLLDMDNPMIMIRMIRKIFLKNLSKLGGVIRFI